MTSPHDVPEQHFPLQRQQQQDVLLDLRPLRQQLAACSSSSNSASSAAASAAAVLTPGLQQLYDLLESTSKGLVMHGGQQQQQRSAGGGQTDVASIMQQALRECGCSSREHTEQKHMGCLEERWQQPVMCAAPAQHTCTSDACSYTTVGCLLHCTTPPVPQTICHPRQCPGALPAAAATQLLAVLQLQEALSLLFLLLVLRVKQQQQAWMWMWIRLLLLTMLTAVITTTTAVLLLALTTAAVMMQQSVAALAPLLCLLWRPSLPHVLRRRQQRMQPPPPLLRTTACLQMMGMWMMMGATLVGVQTRDMGVTGMVGVQLVTVSSSGSRAVTGGSRCWGLEHSSM